MNETGYEDRVGQEHEDEPVLSGDVNVRHDRPTVAGGSPGRVMNLAGFGTGRRES